MTSWASSSSDQLRPFPTNATSSDPVSGVASAGEVPPLGVRLQREPSAAEEPVITRDPVDEMNAGVGRDCPGPGNRNVLRIGIGPSVTGSPQGDRSRGDAGTPAGSPPRRHTKRSAEKVDAVMADSRRFAK